MGLLDKVTGGIKNAVAKAEEVAQTAVAAVKDEVTPAAKPVDEFAGVVAKASTDQPAPAAAPSEHHWYSGITDAFAHTEQAVADTVGSTVKGVESAVDTAAHAVSDAGRAVESAGKQVIDSGIAIVKAGEQAVGDVKHLAQDAGRLVGDAGQVVTDAGKAAYHAGNAALTGNPKELAAANAAVRHARSQVNDAHAAVTDAQAQVADLGEQGKQVATALHQAKTSLENARDTLVAAGSSIGDAATTIASAPRKIMTGVEKALDTGGAELRKAIETDVPGGKSMLQGLDKYAKGAKELGEGVLLGDPFRIAKGIRDEGSGVIDFGKGAWKAGEPAVDYAKRAVTDYVQGFNVEKQIGDLHAGESYELKIAANVHVELGVEGAGSLKVRANEDGTFTVNAGGQLGVNGYLEAGGRVNLGVVNGSAQAEASAHLTAGGNLELKCADAGEAAQAARILEKLAGATSPATLILNQGQVLTKEEAKFLKEHTTSIELGGSLGAEAFGALGLDRGIISAGVGGSLALTGSTSVKIELDNGKPTGVTLTQEYAGEVEAHGGIGLQFPRGNAPAKGAEPKLDKAGKELEDKTKDAPWDVPKSLSGRVEDKLTVATHYELPKSVSLAEFQKDPLAAIKKGAAEMQASATVTATLEARGEGKLGGKQANLKAEISFKGKPSEVFAPGVFDKAIEGDYAGAAKLVGDKVEVDGSLCTYTMKKWGVEDVGAEVFGVGLEGTFQAVKTHEDPAMVKFEKISGTEYATRLSEGLKALKHRAQIRG